MAVYSDYAKDRIGWFFGLTGWQLGTLAVTSLPVFWGSAAVLAAGAALGLLHVSDQISEEG